MKFFSVDSPLYRFLSRLLDILKLNFLWILGSIPIFTIGVSTTAAMSVALKLADDEEGYIAKSYFEAYKANFKQGVPMGLIFLIAWYAVYLDFQLFNNVKDSNIMFLIVFILGLILLFTHYVYAYALMGRYENTVINTLRNSFTISLRYFKKTILIFLVVAFEILLFVWSGTTEFIGLIIGPVCIMFTISGMAKPIFLRIEKDNSGSDDEEEETEEEVDVSEYETIDYEKLAKKAKKNE